jgi:hypothetical protein
MDVRLPDGTVISNVPEGTTKAQLAEKLKANGYDTSKLGFEAEQSSLPRPVRQGVSWANQAIAAVPDAVLNTPANLMNLAKAGFGTAATAAGRPDLAPEVTSAPNYVTRGFEKAGLVNPELDPTTTGGRLAKAAVQGATVGAIAPSQAVKQTVANMGLSGASAVAGQGVTEASGSPELGIAATMATVPALSAAANAARQSSLKAKSLNSMRDQTLADAREEGYVVPPSHSGGNWFTRRLESIAGKTAIGQEATVRNQQVTNKIARREVGLPDDQPISVSSLEARRRVLAEPYREVAAINKQTGKVLEDLKQTRNEATSYWKHYDVSADPKSLAQARQLDAKADALETVIEKAAKRAMKPDLIKELRAARQAIAKTHDVERALNVATGDVSAPVLGRAIDKGKPMTGGLATAGKFQQGFPSAAREGERVQTPGVSKSEAILGTLLGVGGYGMAGPAGVALAALPLASGPTRSLLLSPLYQRGALYPASHLPQVSDPYLRGILASGVPQE